MMFDPNIDIIIVHNKLFIWGIEALIVLVAMMIDLVSGLNKAKARGERTTSRLLRKTVSKFITYEGSLFLGFLVDILIYLGRLFEITNKALDLNYLFLGIPMISTLISIFLVCIEIKSIFEKADQKLADKAADEIVLLKNLAKALGPTQLKTIIDTIDETKKQQKEEKVKKKEESVEDEKDKKIAELEKKLSELSNKKPVTRRGRKRTTNTNNNLEE